MRYLSRDPFARTTTVRAVIRPLAAGQHCRWCGGVRRTQTRGEPSLFRYGSEADAVRPRVAWNAGEFCAKPCHDAFHE